MRNRKTYYIKQYGIQRSATNYIRRLLELNFVYVDVLMHRLGSKHESPIDFLGWINESKQNEYLREPYKNGEIKFITVTKNPYAWLLSSYRYRNKKQGHIDPEKKEFINASFRHYNQEHRAWIKLTENYKDRAIIVKYEDLLQNLSAEMEKIQKVLDLEPLNDRYIDEPKVIKPSEENVTRLTKRDFNEEYYLKQEYLNELSDYQIRNINSAADWNVMAKLGYNKIER